MKKILMAAVAVSALTAGVSSAASITTAIVSNVPLTTGASPLNYALASSVKTATTANLATTTGTAHNTVAATLTSGTRLAGNASGTTYSVTYALTGSATPVFAAPVTSFTLTGAGVGDVSGTGACVPTGLNIVSGGAIGTSSVTGVFTVPSTCSSTVTASQSPNGASFDVPFKISSAGTVTATVSFKIVSTDSAYDGSGGSMQLVQVATPYTVSVEADDTVTRMALGTASTPYLQLDTGSYDAVLGTVLAIEADAPATSTGVVYATMGAATLPAITSNININATSGNFVVITPKIGTSVTGAVNSANNALFTDTGLTTASATNVTVSIASANATSISSIQTYTATVTPTLASTTTVATPAAVTGALQSITLEGVNFLVPWVAGSQTGGSSTQIRISNSGAAVNNVTLSLKSPYNTGVTTPTATTCTSATLSKLSTVASNSELVIDPTDLTTCFGAFKRGDVLVTIQGSYSALSAKARLTTPAGQISEVSLGGLEQTGLAY